MGGFVVQTHQSPKYPSTLSPFFYQVLGYTKWSTMTRCLCEVWRDRRFVRLDRPVLILPTSPTQYSSTFVLTIRSGGRYIKPICKFFIVF